MQCNNFRSRYESSVHVDNKKKDILILTEDPTQGLDGTTLTAQKKHLINFTVTRKKFCVSLHDNGSNSYLFVNGVEIHKFKAKDSETVATALCLGNISKDFSAENMKKPDFMDMLMILVLIMMLLQLMIY